MQPLRAAQRRLFDVDNSEEEEPDFAYHGYAEERRRKPSYRPVLPTPVLHAAGGLSQALQNQYLRDKDVRDQLSALPSDVKASLTARLAVVSGSLAQAGAAQIIFLYRCARFTGVLVGTFAWTRQAASTRLHKWLTSSIRDRPELLELVSKVKTDAHRIYLVSNDPSDEEFWPGLIRRHERLQRPALAAMKELNKFHEAIHMRFEDSESVLAQYETCFPHTAMDIKKELQKDLKEGQHFGPPWQALQGEELPCWRWPSRWHGPLQRHPRAAASRRRAQPAEEVLRQNRSTSVRMQSLQLMLFLLSTVPFILFHLVSFCLHLMNMRRFQTLSLSGGRLVFEG